MIDWTGLGLVRVLEGAGLRFTVNNLPSSTNYQLVVNYEPEVRRPSGLWFCSDGLTESNKITVVPKTKTFIHQKTRLSINNLRLKTLL